MEEQYDVVAVVGGRAAAAVADVVADDTVPDWREAELQPVPDWRSNLPQDRLQVAAKRRRLFAMSGKCDWARTGSRCSLLDVVGIAVRTGVVEAEAAVVAVPAGRMELVVEDSSSAEVAAELDSTKPLVAVHHTMTFEMVLETGRAHAMRMGSQDIQIAAHSCPFVVHFRCSSSPYHPNCQCWACWSTCSIAAAEHHIDLMCMRWPFDLPAFGHSIAPQLQASNVDPAKYHVYSSSHHTSSQASVSTCRFLRKAPESEVLVEWFPVVGVAVDPQAWRRD